MKLFELQSGAIEKELKKKANSIDDAGIGDDVPPEEEPKDGGEDFTDLDSPMGGGQQDMNMMNQPDIPTDAEETEEELDQAMLKKVDSALMTATKKLSYANDYTHDEKSKIHPFRILQMEMGELENLRNIARNKMNMITLDGNFGAYSDPGMNFYRDLINYVENVIDSK